MINGFHTRWIGLPTVRVGLTVNPYRTLPAPIRAAGNPPTPRKVLPVTITLPEDYLMTRKELAERWQTSVGRLANDASAGVGVPRIRIGGNCRYRLSDVVAYENSHRIATLDAS